MKKIENWEFMQVEKKGLITIECPDCYKYFGVDPLFVEKVAEVLYHYTCPYCGKSHTLKN